MRFLVRSCAQIQNNQSASKEACGRNEILYTLEYLGAMAVAFLSLFWKFQELLNMCMNDKLLKLKMVVLVRGRNDCDNKFHMQSSLCRTMIQHIVLRNILC